MIGINPANSRTLPAPPPKPHVGPEYLVVLREGDQRIAGGRSRIADDVIACGRAWLERGLSLEAIERELPFVDARRRRLRELQRHIEGCDRIEIEHEIGYELWAYGSGRSCELRCGADLTDNVTIACYLGQARVARAEMNREVRPVVEAWLVEGCTLADLVARFPNAGPEPHAEALERGEASAWHWLHVQNRLSDSGDALVPLKPLIERLLKRPAVTQFFSFSSLFSLCFSASSHYPWVNSGLPAVWPTERDGTVVVEIAGVRTLCAIEDAVELIESALVAYPTRPFVGSAAMLLVAPLAAELVALGSSLEPKLVQQRQWYRVVVEAGERWCHVSDGGQTVELADSRESAFADPTSLASAAAVIRRWLEQGAGLDELASDPGVRKLSRVTGSFDPD
jgi:hypothetical protein